MKAEVLGSEGEEVLVLSTEQPGEQRETQHSLKKTSSLPGLSHQIPGEKEKG